MDSAPACSNQGGSSSDSVDVDSSTSQEGSEDAQKAPTQADESSPGVDRRKDPNREDSLHSKDTAKKKKSNTTAKLKQNKRDIRREQFLAQVAAKASKGQGLFQQKSDNSLKAPVEALDQGNGHVSCDSTESGSCHLSSVGTDDEEDVSVKSGFLDVGPGGHVTASSESSQCDDSGRNTGVQVDADDSGRNAHPLKLCPGSMNKKLGGDPIVVSTEEEIDGKSDIESKVSTKGKAAGVLEAASDGKLQAVRGSKKSGKNGVHLNGKNGDSERHSFGRSQAESHGLEGDPGSLEDDWEAAAEEFTKQVVKVVNGRESEEEAVLEEEQLSVNPLASSSSSPPDAGPKTTIPLSEYNFRPNQQEGGSRQVLDGCAHSRLCAPNSLRPGYSFGGTSFSRSRSANDRAWRPDDVARPQTLPPALGQRSASRGLLGSPENLGMTNSWRLPQQMSSAQWPAPSAPSSQPACCPICAEELDVTDSSFVPCSCGFRLCLFCHHRIAADDGRCPGCRRAYSPDAANRQPKPSNLWLRL